MDHIEQIEIGPNYMQGQRALDQEHGEYKVVCARDKSLTHRAIIFASLAKGKTTIKNPLWGEDCQATAQAFRSLGVVVQRDEEQQVLTVESEGIDGFSRNHVSIDCGNSGTTARLLTGLLASINGLHVTLSGDDSLSKRPMARVVNPLREMNAKIESHTDDLLLPLEIEGRNLQLRSHSITKSSAQVKSALLLAGCQIDGVIEIELPAGSRNHTELFMENMGARCRVTMENNKEFIAFSGPWVPPSFDKSIPVDPSSAAFLVVWNMLHAHIKLVLPEVLLNPGRLGFLDILKQMGLQFTKAPSQSSDNFIEDVMDLHLKPSQSLQGIKLEADQVPGVIDEIPILAVAAAFADSPSEFHGLRELRVKESDRLHKTWELLVAAGVHASIRGDSLYIEGGLSRVQAFDYNPADDHRLAMAAAIFATRSDSNCVVRSPSCVNVSFPNFFDVLESLPR